MNKMITKLPGFLINLALFGLVAMFAPLEKTLGANIRLVYAHGAWVWAGKVMYALAALAGLIGLLGMLNQRWGKWSGWSLAFGQTGLFFWLTYLPMSLLVMQVNWGGLFLDEPRFRIPLAFGIAGLLLQIGLIVMNTPWLTNAANLLFGVALWWQLGGIENILHPDSPIFGSDAWRIQAFFVALLALALLFGAQAALWLHRRRQKQPESNR